MCNWDLLGWTEKFLKPFHLFQLWLELTYGLAHWGRATPICVSKLTIIASDNGLSPGRRQAIIWNNARILSIGLFRTKFSKILIEILTFSFKKMRLKVSCAKWRPFCLGLNVSRIRIGLDSHIFTVSSIFFFIYLILICLDERKLHNWQVSMPVNSLRL